jgi:hypothetical protein
LAFGQERETMATRSQMERQIKAMGLDVSEMITRHAIDIVVEAPANYRFMGGAHALVTHWFSDYDGARDDAIADASAHLPLIACSDECECRE